MWGLVTFNPLDGFQLVEVKTGKKNNEIYEAAEFFCYLKCVRTLKKTSKTICLAMMLSNLNA